MVDNLTSTLSIDGYDCGVITLSDYYHPINIPTTDIHIDWSKSLRRIDVRDNGKIPVDIWAKMYNNGVIDD